MSHEIRTPMNAILGMLQLLAQTELARRQHDYVEQDAVRGDIAAEHPQRHPGFLQDRGRQNDAGCALILARRTGLALPGRHSVKHHRQKDIEAVLDVDTRLPLDIQGDSLRLQQV
jgi:signal transduction histidine kinase